MKYALNLNEEHRILSAWKVLPRGKYDGMPIVDTVPDGDVTDYRYENDKYIYDPLPKTEPVEPETEVSVWDELDAAYQEGYNEGYTEGVNSAYDQ